MVEQKRIVELIEILESKEKTHKSELMFIESLVECLLELIQYRAREKYYNTLNSRITKPSFIPNLKSL